MRDGFAYGWVHAEAGYGSWRCGGSGGLIRSRIFLNFFLFFQFLGFFLYFKMSDLGFDLRPEFIGGAAQFGEEASGLLSHLRQLLRPKKDKG